MEIPKDMIKHQGKGDQIDQAKQELPDQVDPERDSGKPRDVRPQAAGRDVQAGRRRPPRHVSESGAAR